MNSPQPAGIRAEARARTLVRIEEIADKQLRKDGIPGLSLRAISRELGMAPSAIYRYFANSDALLTHLIIRGYNQLADVVTAAVGSKDGAPPRARLQTLARATRTFFIESPHVFALLYGTPIANYQAPQDTIAPATRVGEMIVELVLEARASAKKTLGLDVPAGMLAAIEPLRVQLPDVDPAVLAIGVAAWNQLFGLISFELFGHFHNVVSDRVEYFTAVMDLWWDRLIGPES